MKLKTLLFKKLGFIILFSRGIFKTLKNVKLNDKQHDILFKHRTVLLTNHIVLRHFQIAAFGFNVTSNGGANSLQLLRLEVFSLNF